uniref:Uncharacterized protein n=1 Tax=Rhizophora mucronata TaxID=61149 RepID=A0A2P2LM18_RHIMU
MLPRLTGSTNLWTLLCARHSS